MIDEDIAKFLIADDGVKAQFGERIYWGRLPQGTQYPAALLSTTVVEHGYELQNEIAMAQSIIQIDTWVDDDTRDQLKPASGAIINRLSGYRGELSDTFANEITIIRDNVLAERPLDKSDKWRHRRSIDFQVFHDNPVPTHGE